MKTENCITVGWIKKTVVALAMLAFFSPFIKSQDVALKSNLLYDATTTLNLGLEIGLAPKWTLELPVNYNPWEFSKNRKLKHWAIQPEARYWFCQRFMGHFMGLHAHVAGYNVGGLKMFGLNEHRYEGYLYGAGISYGYQWILNKRWSIEATVGVGYAYLDHAKYPCEKCAEKIGDFTKNYFGPTKAGISLIYIIK
ncbi:hypothetical protein M2459_002588 [Parabacteroides sp. PF5-5]|nr:hypothetical protein [Parabacteroides sp. PH5-39]MDH6316728.1 hypothetical protein [Parabacteroides sp. PF5-13]MDH6320369.1 hypothetical protein [Parabacteroides sp. PH5-13]MDH6324099.1 hypothetical protein [Parabacteroides sp. PH5-8]MDH6327914.1 hypothetical protein [Parabacteroides sp. PH5-41]MDH6335828.1 hypothetical protein [Parabacteroides sp. PF5-5]MDH6346892.1 hypothetical protein [Parabacteroides sp. PH5-46]MDH6361741.1 hypothetical protein [Parabacteroides sp. PH5-16]MDH6377522.